MCSSAGVSTTQRNQVKCTVTVIEAECPQFLRTVPVLPRDPRYPDKISDAAENHLADACRYGLRFDLTPAFSTRRRWVA
jgi:hypothetical protein